MSLRCLIVIVRLVVLSCVQMTMDHHDTKYRERWSTFSSRHSTLPSLDDIRSTLSTKTYLLFKSFVETPATSCTYAAVCLGMLSGRCLYVCPALSVCQTDRTGKAPSCTPATCRSNMSNATSKIFIIHHVHVII